jgi:pyruvate dehydrogenase E2 component (dihydrolipoamide acetyltransferase)
MPKMGDGMEEGKITTWLKREGDAVREGESIAEVETDKANVEIPAEESGFLTRILVAEGQTAPVGGVIAQIGNADSATAKPAEARPAGSRDETAPPIDIPRMPAEDAASGPEAERMKASPLARKMAAELGIDLARVEGTGPGGRIVERDVNSFRDAHAGARPAARREIPSRAGKKPAEEAPAAAGREITPTRMRSAIARRTAESFQTAPHFYVTMAIDMDGALELLKQINADADDAKITVNDLLVKACALALGAVPQVNATWTDEGSIRLFPEAHVGIAVGIEDGVVIPVLRNCESKSLRRISVEARELIKRARGGQLKPEEFSGGTFSISNLGMMGVEEFTAIINPPEAAILAVGGIAREAVYPDESDVPDIRSRVRVTLSSDHRVLDGVTSARFLRQVKRNLERPLSLLS